MTGLIEGEGFRVLEYSFGPRDLFTYAVIAARRLEKGARREAFALATGAIG